MNFGTSLIVSCAFGYRIVSKLIIQLLPLVSLPVARPNMSSYFEVRENNKTLLIAFDLNTHTHTHTHTRQVYLAFISLELTAFRDDLSMMPSHK